MIEQQHRRRTREAVAAQAARRAVNQRVDSHQPTQRSPGPVGEAHHIHPPGLTRPKPITAALERLPGSAALPDVTAPTAR